MRLSLFFDLRAIIDVYIIGSVFLRVLALISSGKK